MAIDNMPAMFYEVAFNNPPNSTTPPYWTDITSQVQFPWSSNRGRQYELDQNQTGTLNLTLANNDGRFDPTNTASPYYPNVLPYRECRIRAVVGPNQLTTNQATAGQGTGLPPGPIPAWMNITNDYGYPLVIATSGTAYTGTQVYQATLPAAAVAFSTIMLVKNVYVTGGNTYTFSIQTRITTAGQNVATAVGVSWYDNTGALITATAGGSVTPTGGSATWIQAFVTDTAPSNAVIAVIKVEPTAGPLAAQTVWQVGAVQTENNPFPTPYQTPNTVGPNLLARTIATSGLQTAPGDGVGNWFNPTQGTISYVTGLAAAPTGQTTAIAWALPISSLGGTPGLPLLYGSLVGPSFHDAIQVTAGTTYSFATYLRRATGGDATVTCEVQFLWWDYTGTNILSVSTGAVVTVTSSAWVQATVSATAPAGAVWVEAALFLITPVTTTAVNTIYTTASQVEKAGSPTTWTDPGLQAQIFSGFVERWPQTWDQLSGTYGTSQITANDAFAALAQFNLGDPFVNEILTLNPNFFYPLNDPVGSTGAVDVTGKRGPAPVTNSVGGAGSLVFGSSVTSTTVGQAFIGSSGTVATFNNNPATGGPGTQLAETYIDIGRTSATPGPPQSGSWTRLLVFRAPAAPPAASSYHLWAANPATWTPTNFSTFSFVLLGASGFAQIALGKPTTAGYVYTGSTNICDGNWHMFTMSYNPIFNTDYYIDGVQVFTSASNPTGIGYAVDVLGALIVPGANTSSDGAKADVAHAVELPAAINQTQMTNIYNSWRTASSGESTGARFQRVLSWINWPLTTSIAAGNTSSMGPASDIAGSTALQALQAVTVTENGNMFSSDTGILTFQNRQARYNQQVPTYVFGDKPSAGEYHFDQLAFDFDMSHIASNIQVTQYSTGTVYVAFDGTSGTSGPSQQKYFPTSFTRTVNATAGSEVSDAAYYLLSQYKDPHLRASTLLLSPSHIPRLWRTVLNLELGTRIRVNRRPTNAPEITLDGFVESVAWSWDPSTSEVQVSLQVSPANLTVYWQLAAMHTTLHAAATSGTNTISINALPDAAVNVLKSSLNQGTSLVIDPGLSTQETVIIGTGGVPTTTLGYTSATLTLAANMTKNHAINAVVTEVLPASAASPTVYDAQSVLGPLVTSFAAAATSGTNTITVNAFPDSKFNAVASSLPQGYKLRLSPGTVNDETVTITATGSPVTYPGYTTVTFTLTANLTHNHAVNDVVCEPLPAGDTNPNQVVATTRLAY